MKKKSFLSGFNAKIALTIVALSGALLTGCYKDEGLDVNTPGGSVTIPAATYTLTGTVINVDGALVNDATISVSPNTKLEVAGSSFTAAVAPGDVTIKVTPKAGSAYKEVTKIVKVLAVPAGQAVVYTETIVLTQDAPEIPVEKDAMYDLSVIAYGSDNMETALPVADYTVKVSKGGASLTTLTGLEAGVYNVVIAPKNASEYESYVTTLSLPAVKVAEDAVTIKAQVIGVLVKKAVTPTPIPDEYMVLSAFVSKDATIELNSVQLLKNGSLLAETKADYIVYLDKITTPAATYKLQVNYSVKGVKQTPIFRTYSKTEQTFVIVLSSKKSSIPAKPGDYPLGEEDKLDIEDGTAFELDDNAYDGDIDLTRLFDEDSDILTTYEGAPDGLQFINKPLHISFKDKFAGELGQLDLQYRDKAGKWGADEGSKAGKKGDVVLANDKYTMNIWHFSAFRARLPIATDSVAKEFDATAVAMEGEYNNNEDTKKDLIIKGVEYLTGVKFETTVRAAVEKEFKNGNAAALVTDRINKILADRGYIYSADFTKQTGVVKMTLPAYSCISDLSSVQSFKEVVFTFKVAGKTVTITVKVATKNTVKWTILNYGHGHGHDHGHGHGSGNAGGGIVEAE